MAQRLGPVIYGTEDINRFITNSRRPIVRKDTQVVANSILLKREWEVLDAAVIAAARSRIQIVQDLRNAGLVSSTTLAEMLSSWRVGSERRRPDVNMDGRTTVQRDRTERLTSSVPIPIIATEYEIGRRELLASRALGADLDTYEAEEAARAVAEEAERIIIDGNSDVVLAGNGIDGLTSHNDTLTDTASNYGGGDFATEGNPVKAILGAIGALAAISYFGPYGIWVAATQYNEMRSYYTDGSGDTEIDRVERLSDVEFVHPNDFVSDGELIIAQLTSNVIDIREAAAFTNREWEAPNGTAMYFYAMMSMVPRLKPDYKGNLGVLHMTGC